MKILVTGGAGFIGSNLVEELVKKHDVFVIDNLHSGSLTNLKKVKNKITFIESSCKNIGKKDLPKVDLIYHLGMASSSPMYKQDQMIFGKTINGTIGVYEYARKNNVKKVIFASSSSLYNGVKPPHVETMPIHVTDFYTEARLCIERIAELYNNLYGVKSVGLRFFSVYGPHEEAKGKYANIITQFLWEMQKGNAPVIYGNGLQKRDFTYVGDIVSACLLQINNNNEYQIYNVGTGLSYSFRDVVDILNKKLGTDIEPKYVDMPINNYVDHTLADISKIRKLGYSPKYTLEHGIDRLILSTS